MKKLLLMMLSAMLCLVAVAQERTITGKVLDTKTGKGVSGATVKVKRYSKAATVTDAEGNFTLAVPTNATAIIVVNAGFDNEEVALTNTNAYTVSITPAIQKTDEVVIVGYGTQRRKDLTGTVSKISGDKFRDAPIQSFDQALSGRAAGVSVTLPNGVLNNPPVIRVRGVNSISLSSFPLVVIDGVPTFSGQTGGTASNNPLADINPNDIESTEILKDAAAAAIYGSRASAGVLLITTKRGKQGKAKVNYDGSVGWTSPFNLIPLLNAEEYTMFKNEGLANQGSPANGTSSGFYTSKDAEGKVINTDWYDEVYRTGIQQNHNISIGGANDKTNYFFSGGYTKQEGMIKNNDLIRLTARLNLDHSVNNWLKIGGNINYANTDNRAPNTGSIPGQAFGISGLGRLPLVLAPNVAPLNNDGSFNINANLNTIGQGANLTALSFTNPKVILSTNKFSSVNDRIQATAYANVKITKGLNFKTLYGIDNLTVTNKEFQAALHGDGVAQGGLADYTVQSYKRWNWSNVLSYDKALDNGLNIALLVGNEQQYTFQEGFGAQRRQQIDNSFDEYQGGFITIVPSGNFIGENYLASFFGRANIDFKRKYSISINGRRDGYSAFASGKKYGNFGGVSGGWNISDEGFWKGNKFLSNISTFKLKASYGQVGNIQGLGDFASFSLFGSGLYGPNGQLAFAQAGNPNLTWESSKKTDIGLEFGILNNRIT
jgi:TonB-dependent starch-binding outer membrane protein SusC